MIISHSNNRKLIYSFIQHVFTTEALPCVQALSWAWDITSAPRPAYTSAVTQLINKKHVPECLTLALSWEMLSLSHMSAAPEPTNTSKQSQRCPPPSHTTCRTTGGASPFKSRYTIPYWIKTQTNNDKRNKNYSSDILGNQKNQDSNYHIILTVRLLGIYAKNMKILIWKDVCTPMFITALFTIAKRMNE